MNRFCARPPPAGPPPDGGPAAWVRVFAYFGISAGTLGLQYASGLLMVELLSEFGRSRAATSAVGAASTGVMDFFGFVAGEVIVRLGERSTCMIGASLAGLGFIISAEASELWHLYITFSVLVGIGHSCSLFAGVVLNNKWFLKRRSITSAMANTGSAVGPFVLAPVWTRAVRVLGWRGLLRVLGACDFVLLLCASLVLTVPPPKGPTTAAPAASEDTAAASTKQQSSELAPKKTGALAHEVLRNREVRRIALVIGVYGLGSWVPVIHLVTAARDQGFSRERADALVLFIAVGSVSMRVPFGALADMFGRQHMWVLISLLYAAIDVIIPFVWSSYAVLCAYAILAGGFLGSLNSLMVTLAPEVCIPEHMAHATTISTAMLGLGTFCGPVIAGAIFDAQNSYLGGWLFAAACLVLSAIVLALPAWLFGSPGHGELPGPLRFPAVLIFTRRS